MSLVGFGTETITAIVNGAMDSSISKDGGDPESNEFEDDCLNGLLLWKEAVDGLDLKFPLELDLESPPPVALFLALFSRDSAVSKTSKSSSSLNPFNLAKYSSSLHDIVGRNTWSPLEEIEIFNSDLS